MRHRVAAAAALDQRRICSPKDAERQSPVTTANGRPERTSAFAVSWAPWIPWLYVRSAMSQASVTSGTGCVFAMQTGSRVSASARAMFIAGPYVSITTSRPSRSCALELAHRALDVLPVLHGGRHGDGGCAVQGGTELLRIGGLALADPREHLVVEALHDPEDADARQRDRAAQRWP